MEIYKSKKLKKPTFIQKLFNKQPKENAMIEINNLFALHQNNFKNISLEKILEIGDKYKADLKKLFKDNRLQLFQNYLHFCLVDDKLEDSQVATLKHIGEVLMLNPREIENEIKIETEKIYKVHIKDVLKDKKLDESEKRKIERLKKDLLISESLSNKIYKKSTETIMANFIEDLISNERLSPTEEQELDEISKNLGVKLNIGYQTKRVLDRYKLYWQIENGELIEISSDIKIQKSEKLYFKANLNWLEQRRITKRVDYHGITGRIKIARGIYYRAGSMQAQPVSEDILKQIDSGTIYLTNKRLIFRGSKGNKTIRLDKILDAEPYSNGIHIQKDSGKSPFLEFSNNLDIFSMILVRLIDEF